MVGNQGQGHIFISYRRVKPDMDFAYRLADDLCTAGHPIWIDVEGIEGGEGVRSARSCKPRDTREFLIALRLRLPRSAMLRSVESVGSLIESSPAQ